MNFLAHSLFAIDNSERMAGQFCGDFVRGGSLAEYPLDIRIGILMHRYIDAYTDSHERLEPLRNLFEPPHRRFAGIITDVLFDYFIADNWQHYSDIEFEEHVAQVHTALAEHEHVLPTRLNRFANFLRSERVFESYQTLAGVELALDRLSHRSHRFSVLKTAAPFVSLHIQELHSGFEEFFPQLQLFVSQVRPEAVERASGML